MMNPVDRVDGMDELKKGETDMQKICGICEEIKEAFCDECSTSDHYEWREIRHGRVEQKPVLVVVGRVCTDCCICGLRESFTIRDWEAEA